MLVLMQHGGTLSSFRHTPVIFVGMWEALNLTLTRQLGYGLLHNALCTLDAFQFIAVSNGYMQIVNTPASGTGVPA